MAPNEWMSNMFSVINELWIERDRIEQVLEYLRWIHEVLKIIVKLGTVLQ